MRPHARRAVRREGRHHRGPDRDVRTGVEQVGRLTAEPRRPRQRDRHEAEGRATALLRNARRLGEGLVGRREVIVRGERDVVADEERVGVGHLADERLDELIVRVKAAREDDRQEVHSGLATVSALTGTGPK